MQRAFRNGKDKLLSWRNVLLYNFTEVDGNWSWNTWRSKKCHAKTIESILTNEKYKGDALLQKYYTVGFLSKKWSCMRVKCLNVILKTITQQLLIQLPLIWCRQRLSSEPKGRTDTAVLDFLHQRSNAESVAVGMELRYGILTVSTEGKFIAATTNSSNSIIVSFF